MSDCREQSFDNASNMLGKTKEMQVRLLENQPTAVYSSYAAHSLNLVGLAAMMQPKPCCNCIITHFASISHLYKLFNNSPN